MYVCAGFWPLCSLFAASRATLAERARPTQPETRCRRSNTRAARIQRAHKQRQRPARRGCRAGPRRGRRRTKPARCGAFSAESRAPTRVALSSPARVICMDETTRLLGRPLALRRRTARALVRPINDPTASG